MKDLLTIGTLCLVLSGASGCKTPPPKIMFCIIGDEGLICKDERLPEGQEDFVIPHEESKNMICTSPDDFQTIQEWIIRRCKR